MTLFMKHCLQLFLVVVLFSSCSLTKQIDKSAREIVLKEDALQTAHVGISIYEPATGKYWYNYNGDKYFVPASNTKLPTCYAAMKYLGDSLVGGRYAVWVEDSDTTLILFPSGDPTFLNSEFPFQPLFNVLTQYKLISIDISSWKSKNWGNGWAWNDYGEPYMAERSQLPVYANMFRIFLSGNTITSIPKVPSFSWASFDTITRFIPETRAVSSHKFSLVRDIDRNTFNIRSSTSIFDSGKFPIKTNLVDLDKFLEDTLKVFNVSMRYSDEPYVDSAFLEVIHSQPTDSLLKPMMYRSDNFFAEQSLLMVSNELLGVMNDSKIIDTLLKTDFKDLPQKPRWVDGSGLSRYNLFSPQDFVFILNKMKTDFGMDRIKNILPTGNKGTLEGRFVPDSNYIFAKTGTLSGVVALSGFLYTKKNKLLIFSVLVNNHNASASGVRNAVEKFIHGVRENY